MTRYRAAVMKALADLRASYWFVPFCLVLFSLTLALLTLWLDSQGGLPWELLPTVLINTQVDGARAILSVIAQSVIGVTGVMFSVTMVAVSFASGNFGPRLVGNFMRDRGNQWSMGVLIAVFVYALIILRGVEGPVDDQTSAFVPQVSLVVSMALALVAVGVMIYFVHHVPETINVSNIAAALGTRLCKATALYAHTPTPRPEGAAWDGAHRLTLEHAGYVQRLELSRLSELAQDHGLDIRVTAPPGAFVLSGACVAEIRGALDETQCAYLRDCFALGPVKTEAQNVTFLIEQLVEMAARAMSPGVNDPFTAINCLNWLASGLAQGAEAGDAFGLEAREGAWCPTVDMDGLLAASFGASYPYVQDDALARDAWTRLLEELRDTGQSEALRAGASRLLGHARRD